MEKKITQLFCELIDYELTPDKIIQYLQYAYAVGYDKGIKDQKAKHSNNLEIPILQLDDKKKVIKKWPSIREACRVLEISSINSLLVAIKKKRKSCGFYWRAA
jgi:hypothetical protein